MITGGRKTLGVFMNKADLNFQNTVQRVVQEKARVMDYDVFFFFTVGYRESANFYDEQEKGMFAFTPMEKLDGALVTPDAYDMPGFREALFDMLERRATCPVVCVRDSRSAYDSIYTDESVAIRPLMAHLLDDHGLRRVCFQAGYKEHPDSEKRLKCYLEEMGKRGIPLPEGAVYHGSMWTRGADKAYDFFFGSRETWPEAVVCANDYMAQALIEQVQKHGYNVPEDVVITGFDDIEDSDHSLPPLTTVGQDYEQMVNSAMDLLHAKIQAASRGEELPAPRHVGLPGSLKIRESCGCSNGSHLNFLTDEVHRLGGNIREIYSREVSQTYFSIELNSVTSYEEIHHTIARKLEDTPAVRDFYLCLFEDENGLAESVTSRARLISAIRDRKDAGIPNLSFDRTLLLPELAERPGEPQTFYIHLLHQRDNTYGYTVTQFDRGKTPSMFYLHWNIIVSIALRNLADQAKLRALYEERRLSSITDVLTGLNNRRGLLEKLEPCWEDMCAQGRTVSFVSLDMDNLKPINDTYGHQGGDLALCLVADALRSAGPADGVFARVGGDEYLVFLPDHDEDAAQSFIRAFDAELDKRNRQHSFSVGASVGCMTAVLAPGMTTESCIHTSDERMYQEKKRRQAALKCHARGLR